MSKNRQKQNKSYKVLTISDMDSVTQRLRQRLLKNTNDQIGIIARNHQSLGHLNPKREIICPITTSTNLEQLLKKGHFTIVYVNLKTPTAELIHSIIKAMKNVHLERLILIINSTSNSQVSQITKIVKNSQLKYTIIRTARINHSHLLSYQIMKNAQPVNDSNVSVDSVTDLAFQIIRIPSLHLNEDLGIIQLPYK